MVLWLLRVGKEDVAMEGVLMESVLMEVVLMESVLMEVCCWRCFDGEVVLWM